MRLLTRATITLLSCALAGAACAQSSGPFLTQTHVYKNVPSCTIELDVIRSSNPHPKHSAPRPTVVFIHGGALIGGSRETIPWVVRSALERLVEEESFILVSIDYRLAPETKLPQILTDLEDAFDWVRVEGAALYGVDPDRVAAVGSSAGGYLALTAGFRLVQRPRAIVSVSGYGAFGQWAIQPGRLELPLVTLPEALACVGKLPVSNGVYDRPCHAGAYYIYGRQQGQGFWPRSVTGIDPIANPGRYFGYSPVHKVSAQFPPTLLVHGDLDLDVPYFESVQMADELSLHNVEHVLNVVRGAGHNISGVAPQVTLEVSKQIFNYLLLHLKSDG